jgi:hypothetical protein
MSHPQKALLALFLLAIANPAAASDFTGFLAMFIGTPFLLFAFLFAGFIQLRRRQPSSTTTGLALAALIAAVVPFAFLSLLAHSGLAYSWAPVLVLYGLAAWHIWRNPRTRLAPALAGLLLVLAVIMGGLMAWDLSHVLGRGNDTIYPVMLVLLTMFVGTVWLCFRVIRPRRERATDSNVESPPPQPDRRRFTLGSVHQGVLPAVILLLAAAYGVFAVMSKLKS